MAAVLAASERVDVVAMCADGDSLWAAIERESPDVAIVDIRMPPSGDQEGINIASRLRRERPEIGLIALSQWAEPAMAMAFLRPSPESRGYLLKERLHDGHELVNAIEVVAGGGRHRPHRRPTPDRRRASPAAFPVDELTPREREVLSLMARGKSNRAIAEDLTLTKRAVEKHVGSIFMKLELDDEEVVSRRVAAVLMYLAGTGGRLGDEV